MNGYAFGFISLNRLTEQGECVFTQGDKVLSYGGEGGCKISCNVKIVKSADRYVLRYANAVLFETVDQTDCNQIGGANNSGDSFFCKVVGCFETTVFGKVAVAHITAVELNVTFNQADQVARKTLAGNNRVLISTQKADLFVTETDQVFNDGSNRVDVVTADAGNLGIFDVGVHQHSGNVCGFQLLNDGTVQFCSQDHQAAKVVFLAQLFEVGRIFIGAVFNYHFVVVSIGCLLKSCKNRIADLRIAVRIHVFKQYANAFGVLVAV